MAEQRFQVFDGSQSGHCCFEYTVVDSHIAQKHSASGYEAICETFEREQAEIICNALNITTPK
jgi:hypothetical protein